MDAKKIAAGGVLIASIAVSVFLVRGTGKQASGPLVSFTAQANARDTRFSFGAQKQKQVSQRSTNGRVGNPITANMTDALIHSYGTAIAEKNKNGLQRGNKVLLPSSNALSAAVTNQASQPFPFETLTIRDIYTVPDQASNAERVYFDTITALSIKNFPRISFTIFDALDDYWEKGNSKKLEQLTTPIPKHVQSLLAVRPPSALGQFHLDLLNLWQKKLAVYRAMLAVADDPVRAYLAALETTDLTQETQILQEVARERYEKLTQS